MTGRLNQLASTFQANIAQRHQVIVYYLLEASKTLVKGFKLGDWDEHNDKDILFLAITILTIHP